MLIVGKVRTLTRDISLHSARLSYCCVRAGTQVHSQARLCLLCHLALFVWQDFIPTNATFPDSVRWFVYLAHRRCLSSYEAILSVSGHFVYIFHVAPKISTLGESLIAERASVGALARVLPKVVP